VLTGVAALVAGAFSMGTGEYISVTNQNELVHAEVALERGMHARFPAAEQAELADTFRGQLVAESRRRLGATDCRACRPYLRGVASLLGRSR
jgi:VIT1/CCC1 family predicted Fe2+/Mn2+ transporter